jgi:hypothetical protein
VIHKCRFAAARNGFNNTDVVNLIPSATGVCTDIFKYI